ncbi:NUDIX hydrolase [Curtobacterium sp. MCPF17_052]|uniref:NUDIX hydrolase n=1 Tax=Curtobacterium sp. MCPF17_052 TaxID=2175655 RepID=UPI00346400B1
MSGGQSGPVIAAGAVVWREQDGEPLVLLIHREHHKDVSFPKGKVDPGESIPEAAVREIDEETGYRVHLGAPPRPSGVRPTERSRQGRALLVGPGLPQGGRACGSVPPERRGRRRRVGVHRRRPRPAHLRT